MAAAARAAGAPRCAPASRLLDDFEAGYIKFAGREPRTLEELAFARADYEHRCRVAEIKAMGKKLALLQEFLPALAERGIKLAYRKFASWDGGKVLRVASVSGDNKLHAALIELGFREIERKHLWRDEYIGHTAARALAGGVLHRQGIGCPGRRCVMKRIGTFRSKRWGVVQVYRGTYLSATGPTAIVLRCVDGEPLATLSVNMYEPDCSGDSRDLPADCFYVKQWSENEVLAAEALESGLFKQRDDLPPARSGHVSAPVWQIVGGLA